MRAVVFIQNKRYLKSYLRGLCPGADGKFRYIACAKPDSRSAALLEREGFREIVISEAARGRYYNKQRFISEYVDLIGAAGKECNTKKWWATTIASKERFTSQLPGLLEKFLFIAETVKKEDFTHLLILNPSWVIVSSLRDFARCNNISLLCRLNPFRKWAEAASFYCRRAAGVFYHGLRIYFRACWARARLKNKLKNIFGGDKQYYVLKNFIYDQSFKKGNIYEDVFFGCLPGFLKDKRNILLYSCIVGNYKRCISKIRSDAQYDIAPLEYFISFRDIIEAAGKLLWGKVHIKRSLYFFGYDVKAIVNNELLRTFNDIQFYQFLHYWSTRNLLSCLKAQAFVLTYENKAWERMCIMAVRENSPQTKIIGYQHTVVPQASVNMFASRYEDDTGFLPDSILTVGRATKEIMEKYGSYGKNKINVSCGLRFEYLFKAPLLERKRSGNILLAPEGISEVYKMVNYVMQELKNNPYYNVTIRTHPILPFNCFKHKLGYDISALRNFKLSSGVSLKEDIQRADMVIYWGSTVGLEALALGRPAVHFDTGSLLSYDPLFECNHLKWRVFERDSLLAVIEEINSLSDDDFMSQRLKAKEYIKSHFHSITEERLSEFTRGLS